MTDGELRLRLEEVLGTRVEGLELRSSAYRSSFPLDELDVRLADGSILALVLKDLSRTALEDSTRAAKPEFLYDPLREIETYQTVLASGSLGTAMCYGAVVDPPRDRYWLFLERVDGVGLWQIGDFSTWEEAARWLRRMHMELSQPSGSAGHLLRYDAAFYTGWLERARETVPAIARIAPRYSKVVERLVALPATFIHGEFYASNVLVESNRRSRICPIDWEMAGIGPSLIDLAALASGNWTDEQRAALAAAYVGGTPSENFLIDLDCCLLQLAVQWLGWSSEWFPPRQHAHDWLGEAIGLAEALGI